MDITELKQRLDVVRTCQHLLPNGRKNGNEWCVGSIRGEKGQSLRVHLAGDKAGVWSDFASGQSGDIIELWRAVKGLTLAEAIADIKGYLGVTDHKYHRPLERTYQKPQRPTCRTPAGPVKDYLREDRNISQDAVMAYKVGEQGREIVFPSLVGGDLVFAKFLKVDRPAGKKVSRVAPGCEPVLFGWQAIPEDAREVVIEEGELNALSLWDYGRPALGVPFGAGGGDKQRWIENEFERLERFETIYLRFDDDEPGAQAIQEIISRLGRHRCRVVRMPQGDDPNECLQKGVPKVDIDAAFANARTMDPEGLRSALSFADEVIELFWPSGGEEPGYALPWGKARDKVRLRPAEVTVWQGSTGAGKSQALSHVSVKLVAQGARICIASLEMRPERSLKRMVKQASSTDRPTNELIHATLGWLDGHVWLFDLVGKSKVSQLLEIFEYARRRYGVDVFIIDSFMRLGIAPDDYAAQDKAIFEIVDWAVSVGVHVHLVAHSRKGDAKGPAFFG